MRYREMLSKHRQAVGKLASESFQVTVADYVREARSGGLVEHVDINGMGIVIGQMGQDRESEMVYVPERMVEHRAPGDAARRVDLRQF